MDGDAARSTFTRLVITAEMQAGLDRALQGLVQDHGALSASLVERSGMVIATAGIVRPAELAVGALIGGVFKSLASLAGLLGENPIQELIQRGASSVTIMSHMTTGDVLVASFSGDRQATQILEPMRRCSGAIAPLMTTAREAPQAAKPLSLTSDGIDDLLGNF